MSGSSPTQGGGRGAPGSEKAQQPGTMSGDGGGKVTKPSPRSKAREMLLKSPSVRMLESEGGSNQLAYAEFGYGESNDDDLSLSCLHAVKKLQETGRWDEAQLQLETATQQSKTPREQAMGALLLAELFNKWGAASPAYSVDIMDKGAGPSHGDSGTDDNAMDTDKMMLHCRGQICRRRSEVFQKRD